jgi:hypothetical protein
MYEMSEHLEITYTFGLSTAAVLQRASEDLLAEAVRLWDKTREPQRLFAGFWYRAGSWPVAHFVVVKAEANAQGTNRRFAVTSAGRSVISAVNSFRPSKWTMSSRSDRRRATARLT